MQPEAIVLFQGDSITDAARDRTCPADLGHGFAALAATALRSRRPDLTVLNRGVAGNRIGDLRDRWEADTLAHRPALLTVLIGVNDTWHYYEGGPHSPVEVWEEEYRGLLARLHGHCAPRLVLIEPFLVPVTPEQWTWRGDLDPRIHAVRRLAAEHDALLLAADGVHPTALGHRLLAEAWLRLVDDAVGG